MPFYIVGKEKGLRTASDGTAISVEDLDDQRSAFARNFVGATGISLELPDQVVEWKALADKFPVGNPGAAHPTNALKVHYGYAQNKFCFGIQQMFVGAPTSGEYPLVEGPFYEVINGQLFLSTLGTWTTQYKEPYLNSVRVSRNGAGAYETLHKAHEPYPDAASMIFPWDWEIWRLFVDNNGGLTTNPEEFRIIFCCAAALYDISDGGPAGYRHGMCMYMERKTAGSYVPLLVKGSPVTSFRFNAADIGHPCPPRCPKARFIDTPPRP